jgi:hypothetical protein
MNSASIASFRTRVATEISDTLGIQISVGGGAPFMAHVSTPAPSMSLETGGFGTSRTINVRWPVGRASKPAIGTSILLVAENLSFRVQTATSLAGSPLNAEILVSAIRE